MQCEVDGMKEQIEELTLDLEILRNEISEKGKFCASLLSMFYSILTCLLY